MHFLGLRKSTGRFEFRISIRLGISSILSDLEQKIHKLPAIVHSWFLVQPFNSASVAALNIPWLISRNISYGYSVQLGSYI